MFELWQKVANYFLRPELSWALGLTVVFVLILLISRRVDRQHVINALELYLFCVLGKFASAWIMAFGFVTEAEVIHEIFVVGCGLIMINLAGLLLFRLLLPALRLSAPRIIEDIVIFVGYIAWIVVRLRLAGMDLAGLVTTSAVMTAVVAFAMQDTLGNTLGGLALQLENSIRTGDWIKVGSFTGRVSEIRWRCTLVDTRDGETVIFPNSFLMKNQFVVVSSAAQKRPEWRRWIWFRVPASVPPVRVIESAQAALATGDMLNVAREPEPSCVLMELGSGFSRYALRYWLVDPGPDDPTDSRVRMRLIAALERDGIEFALADHVLQMVPNSEKHQRRSVTRERKRRLAVLRAADLLEGLGEDVLLWIAERLQYVPFINGDVLVREGTRDRWLVLLAEGEVDAWTESPTQGAVHLATLSRGQVLSESGLLTNEPRRTTLIAKSYAQCYRLEKGDFEQLIRSQPESAEQIARVLSVSETVLAGIRREGSDGNPGETALRVQSVLGKMRQLLGLRP